MIIKSRPKDRMPEFFSEVQKYWEKVPDWRFGQLLINVLGENMPVIFTLEEEQILERFEEFFTRYGKS